MDTRAPVLVGAGAVTQRCADPNDGVEAIELMIQATRAAGTDAGAPGLLTRATWLGVPQGSWSYGDPGRLVGDAVGAIGAHTVLAEVGILQEDLLTRACEVVARGDADVALVVGGEAKHRGQLARRAGLDLLDTISPGEPGDHWLPATLGIADLEIERNIVNPVVSYALVDRAVAGARGWSASAHRSFLGGLWASFAQVAAANPDAWDRTGPTAEEITEPAESNRLLAFPYTRLLASQWNVDQAAALIVCSVDAARAVGVPEERWVFPWASAVSNHAVPLVQRPELHRSPGAELAVNRLFEAAGVDDVASVAHVDLYSCFPAAVQVFADALGFDLAPPFADPPTVTGGMTFAGGPLNNYVLQAMVALVRRLRAEPDAIGLSSSVSTFLTKQGFSLWSARPPSAGFVAVDVTAEAAAADEPRPLDGHREGEATVVASTVDRAGGEPRLVAITEFPDGARTIGTSTDPDAIAALEQDDGFTVGSLVDIGSDGQLS